MQTYQLILCSHSGNIAHDLTKYTNIIYKADFGSVCLCVFIYINIEREIYTHKYLLPLKVSNHYKKLDNSRTGNASNWPILYNICMIKLYVVTNKRV